MRAGCQQTRRGICGIRGIQWDRVSRPKASQVRGGPNLGNAGGEHGPGPVRAAIGAAVEGLEIRRLLSATFTAAVYVDANNNGVQDAGEAGIGGVRLQLEKLGGGVGYIQQLDTGPDGTALFTGLPAGQYKLTEDQSTVPAPYLDGKDALGTGGGTLTNNSMEFINVNDGDAVSGYTFGEVPPATVSGVVFADLNANGVQDPGEPGIADVAVDIAVNPGDPTVFNPGPNQTTVTGPDGVYLFTNLPAGVATIRENPSNSPNPTPGYFDGPDVKYAADGILSNDRLDNFTLAAGATVTNPVTFGELAPRRLSGFVYNDLNNNGAKDPGEPGIAGASVRLQRIAGSPDPTVVNNVGVDVTLTTAADGSFSFTNLPPGYYLLTETTPAGYLDGIDTAGTVGTVTSNDRVENLLLTGASDLSGYLFGERLPGLYATAYADTNNNGARDAGEAGLPGVRFQLEQLGGGFLQQLDTDASGNVIFTGLPAGQYKLTEDQSTVPAPYLDGIDRAGTGGGTATNNAVEFINVGGSTAFVTGYTFGEVPPTTLTGTVFDDCNNNGVQDPGEAGIAGVFVDIAVFGNDPTAFNPSANQAVITDANGVFTFNNVPPGTGLVRENPQNLPNPIPGFLDGIDRTTLATGTLSNDRLENFTVPVGATLSNVITFGEAKAARLTGKVFIDANNNGAYDPGEAGVPDIGLDLGNFPGGDPTEVNLYYTQLSTDSNGNFDFENLPPGQFLLRQFDTNLPNTLADGAVVVGSDGGVNDGANRVDLIPIAPGDDASGYLFAKRALNTPPVLAPVPPLSGSEGSPITFTAVGSDVDDPATPFGQLTYSLVGAPAGAAIDPATGAFTWTPPDAGAYAFTVRVTDGGSPALSADQPVTVAVANVAPTAAIIGPAAGTIVASGAGLMLTGTFSDPGLLDTHTAVWTLTSLSSTGAPYVRTFAGTVGGTSAAGTVSAAIDTTADPLPAGVYHLSLTVTDDDGGSGSASTIGGKDAYFVVYDPSAGYVTGGGWIDSPTGAYAADPTLSGQASFGFVSQYQKGADVPTGQTEFQFQAAGLNFHSSSYDWMVVAGAKAQYRGTGTLNGVSGYRFTLTAIDGQVDGGGGVDKFRIRIWGPDGGLVYDNQMGAADGADPTTVLGGGSIVIHQV